MPDLQHIIHPSDLKGGGALAMRSIPQISAVRAKTQMDRGNPAPPPHPVPPLHLPRVRGNQRASVHEAALCRRGSITQPPCNQASPDGRGLLTFIH